MSSDTDMRIRVINTPLKYLKAYFVQEVEYNGIKQAINYQLSTITTYYYRVNSFIILLLNHIILVVFIVRNTKTMMTTSSIHCYLES